MSLCTSVSLPGRRKPSRGVPLILQMEAAECGAACLAMVLAAFGRWETLDAVRDGCGASRDGVSAADILSAARSRGLEGEAFSCNIEELGELPLPQILFWDFDHFVVLESIRRDGFIINDPAHGRLRVDRTEFGRRFTGVTLAFTPGETFRRTARPRSTVSRLAGMLHGSAGAFAAVILTSAVMVALAVLIPGLTRIFVDEYLVQGYGDWLAPLLGGLLAVGGLHAALTALHLRGLLLLQTKITAALSARFVWQLFHLPYEFFVRRSPAEVSGRAQLAGQVAGTVCGPLAQAAVNLLALAVHFAIMLLYSTVLAAVVLALSMVNLAVLRAVSRRIREQAAQLQMVSGQAHAAAVQGVTLLEQARATGTESILFNRMVQAEIRLINAEQRSGRTTRLLSALPYAMSRLTTLAVLGTGALLVTWTEMTLGTLLGFLMISELFSAALGTLTGVGTAIGQSAGALGRLGDALDRREETPARRDAGAGDATATGRIVVEDISFAYPNGSPVLSRLSLSVEPGECVGVMGASGSGKSTLARLLVGLAAPSRGTIRFEVSSAEGTGWSREADGIAFVDQAPFLPGGSLRAALTLWNPTASTADIRRALADAEIAEVVESRAGALDGPIGEGGGGFSGGERQRLALARALVDMPAILVLDDATSALDERTEARLLENLRRRGVTVVLLTNRASAIRHLDRAVALHGGRLVPVSIEEAYEASHAASATRPAGTVPEPA